MSYSYDQYLNEHIANVNKGLQWMLDNLPLNPEQKSAIETAMANHHDESKYDQDEYHAYDAYFYGGNRSYKVVQDFNRAWLRHQHRNPHHWQYWVLINDEPGDDINGIPYEGKFTNIICMKIPLEYIFEMIADWWAFSWKKENLLEIFSWYGAHREYQLINSQSRVILEDILKMMWNVLILTEVKRGKDIDELEKQYISCWTEQDTDILNWNHPSAQVIGNVVDARETENGLEVTVEHSEPEDDEGLYGVPELKKFPMPDKKHVKSAIRFFNYVDPKYEKELAEAILEKAEEFGLDLKSDISVGDENRFQKYLKKEATDGN